jgi:hypothetical protein
MTAEGKENIPTMNPISHEPLEPFKGTLSNIDKVSEIGGGGANSPKSYRSEDI